MPIVRRVPEPGPGPDTGASTSSLVRLGEQLSTHELLRTPVADLANGSLGAALFVVHRLRKLAEDRYDGLRVGLIDRVRKLGRVQVDVLARRGSASAYLDGWAVGFTIIPKIRTVESLLLNPKTKHLVVKTVDAEVVGGEQLPCPTCGGTGFCTGAAEMRYEVDLNAVGRAIDSGKVTVEDVATLEWRLGQIVPPGGHET